MSLFSRNLSAQFHRHEVLVSSGRSIVSHSFEGPEAKALDD